MKREEAVARHEEIARGLDTVRRAMAVFGGLYEAQMHALDAMAGRARGFAQAIASLPPAGKEEAQ